MTPEQQERRDVLTAASRVRKTAQHQLYLWRALVDYALPASCNIRTGQMCARWSTVLHYVELIERDEPFQIPVTDLQEQAATVVLELMSYELTRLAERRKRVRLVRGDG